MEQHPIPQNVTTFQFRLVGDMTVKQFGYLAGGIIGGYVCYKLPLPFFFTWPLAVTSGLLGFGLAFVPVEERPMDIWIASFFKNVYSPTQWVWQKEKRAPTQPHIEAPPAKQADAPHASMLAQIINAISSFFASIVPSPKITPATRHAESTLRPRAPQQAPTPQVAPTQPASQTILSTHYASDPLSWLKKFFQTKPTPSLSPGFSFADALTARSTPSVTPAPTMPQPTTKVAPNVAPPTTRPIAHERVVELQGQLSDALRERERLEKELITMRQRMDNQTKTASQAPIRQASIMPSTPTTSATSVRVIAPDAATKAGLPRLTTFPNVVTGIVKDHYGNLLAGMLITVRDKDDIPLRALKTNKLGQFAASTPLPNNTYIVEIEDPKGAFIFDKAQIALTGAVAPPIEVTAKSHREVERDKLAKEIFGQNQI